MREVPKTPSPEHKEQITSYSITARHPRGGDELLGRFILNADGVEFLPNTKPQESRSPVLEEVFKGRVIEFVDPRGQRTYHLSFPADKRHLSLSMIFGVRRQRKNGAAFPEIMASMGHTNDDYGTWQLSEDQWQEIDEWLQLNLKKAET